VKASLLFLRKYDDQEAATFADIRDKAIAEVDAKYAPAIAAEKARLEREMAEAKAKKDKDAHKAAQRRLAEYLSKMEEVKTREARALLKERFDYPIFLYEAEKVGISATGEPDANELYPNASLPAGMKPEDTCLELYRRFLKDPDAFVLEGSAA
jgi:type I restriction enzyme M protein